MVWELRPCSAEDKEKGLLATQGRQRNPKQRSVRASMQRAGGRRESGKRERRKQKERTPEKDGEGRKSGTGEGSSRVSTHRVYQGRPLTQPSSFSEGTEGGLLLREERPSVQERARAPRPVPCSTGEEGEALCEANFPSILACVRVSE